MQSRKQLHNTRTVSSALILLLLMVHAPVVTLARSTPEEQVYIRLNQLGYSPHHPKIAIAFANMPFPDSFQVVNATTKKVAFTGRSVPIAGAWGQFEYHAELNFTALQNEGRYFIQLMSDSPPAAVVRSPQFQIGRKRSEEHTSELQSRENLVCRL